MPNNSVSGDRLPEPSAFALGHAGNFDPTIQDTLSALANIEARYQYERERLERRSGPEGGKPDGSKSLKSDTERSANPWCIISPSFTSTR